MFLLELQANAGINVIRTTSTAETVTRILSLWKVYQKPPSEHSSLHRMYVPTVPVSLTGSHPVLRRVVKEFPGVSWERSGWLNTEFNTLESLLELTPPQLVRIKAKLQTVDGIGPKTADNFIKSLRGELK